MGITYLYIAWTFLLGLIMWCVSFGLYWCVMFSRLDYVMYLFWIFTLCDVLWTLCDLVGCEYNLWVVVN